MLGFVSPFCSEFYKVNDKSLKVNNNLGTKANIECQDGMLGNMVTVVML